MYGSVRSAAASEGAVASKHHHEVDVSALAGSAVRYSEESEGVLSPRGRHLYVNDDESGSHIFTVCNEAASRSSLSLRHVLVFVVTLGMALFLVAVSLNKSETIGCTGLDCVFSSSGITKSINTTSSVSPN